MSRMRMLRRARVLGVTLAALACVAVLAFASDPADAPQATGAAATTGKQSCDELAKRVEAAQIEVNSMTRDAAAGDGRFLECQAAIAAAFAERREMKQSVSSAVWTGAAHRMAVELNLLLATARGRRFTRDRGDPMRAIDEAVKAAVQDGVFEGESGPAGSRLAELGRAVQQAPVSARLGTAAVDALRALLQLMGAASASRMAVPEQLVVAQVGERSAVRFEQPDALFATSSALAGRQDQLRPLAAALDNALAELGSAMDREKRPADQSKEALDKKHAALARLQAELAACGGRD